jgi:hypothetical protein
MLFSRRSLFGGFAAAPAFVAASAMQAPAQPAPHVILPQFLAYAQANQQQTFRQFDRSQPLLATNVAFDNAGLYNPQQCCFVAPYPCIVRFEANVLWLQPGNPETPMPAINTVQDLMRALELFSVNTSLLLFKNELPPPGGSNTGEWGGEDRLIMQPFWSSGANLNASSTYAASMQLRTGDQVWCVPCTDQANGCQLDFGSNPGVNFFAGMITG